MPMDDEMMPAPGSQRQAPSRLRRELAWFGTFALLVATVLGVVALVAKVVVCVAGGYGHLLRYVLASWRTVAVLPLAVLLAAVRGRTERGPGLAHLRRDAWRWAAGLAALAAVLAAQAPRLYLNAYGWNVNPPDAEFWIDRGHPQRPPALVRTNALGFRDPRRWTASPAPGTSRVVTVGDSYAFGSGVPEADGTLARRLEAALAARGGAERWEVLNAGNPGWGLVTYFEVARRLVAELRPRAIVIGSLGWSDWDVLENAQLLARLGPTGYRVLGALSVVEDLREASLLAGRDAMSIWDRERRAPGQDRFAAALDGLLRDADAAGVEVVVWEYYDPLPFLDAYEGRPRFHRAGWPPGFDRRWDGWGNDPVLAIPIDKHPTAEGNRRVAEALAPAVAAAVHGGASAPVAGAAP